MLEIKLIKKNRKVDFEEAKNFANQNKLSYFETSAVSGENVNECFETIVDNILYSEVIEEDKNWKKENDLVDIQNPREISCFESFINWLKNIFNFK